MRVCLTPWSVFQDGWRHPIVQCQVLSITEKKRLAATVSFLHSHHRLPKLYFRSFYRNSCYALITKKASTNPTWKECLGSWPWPMKWRYVPCRCHDFRFYVTLFPKCFSNFRSRYLFAIGLPTLYLTLADTYLPLHAAFPSSATLLSLIVKSWFMAQRANTGLGLNTHMRGCSSNGSALHIEFRHSATNHAQHLCHNSKAFELRIRQRVGSLFGRPWLRESRLFSFPPLNNMLKFGG